MVFHQDILKIDCERDLATVIDFIRNQVTKLNRDGVVVGLSGGIDSALCSALCVEALGRDRVFGLILPERESSPVSREYAETHARKLDIEYEVVDITPVLEAFGTYVRRDAIIRKIVPGFKPHHRIKITLPPDLLKRDAYNIFRLTTEDESGRTTTRRLNKAAFHGIAAAGNTKQRVRMLHLYYSAEKSNAAVCGTTNRSETQQGFFVRYGDGGVDLEPIAHLYKTQVYQLAEHLGVPEEIMRRAPSPDTYSMEVSDEEFFFRMPYRQLDLLLYAWENEIPVPKIASVMGLSEDQVNRVLRDLRGKYRATRHLRELPPSLL